MCCLCPRPRRLGLVKMSARGRSHATQRGLRIVGTSITAAEDLGSELVATHDVNRRAAPKMTFVSYAQNFEDVLLWRALGSVEAGFWIDVGAADPTEFSVTRAFYDRGWHGVNIEPEPDYAAALRADRQRDINLQVAIAAAPGRATLHRFAGTGLSTFDAEIAAQHAAAGYPIAEPLEVEVTTLAAVCAAYASSDIHFLKIDVEGAEREVLLSADLRTYRPWIILVEGTFPGSSVPRLEAFADLLIAAGYHQCWFDGLNAFFLAAEHERRLTSCFQTLPTSSTASCGLITSQQ